MARECLQCGTTLVLLGEGGSVWGNVGALSGSRVADAPLSAAFGLRVAPASGNAVGVFAEAAAAQANSAAHQQLADLLQVYKGKLEERNEARLRALREQLQRETKEALDVARREADSLWGAIMEAQQRKAVPKDVVAVPAVAATAPAAKHDVKRVDLLSSQEGVTLGSSGLSSSSRAKSPTLWMLDEEQEDPREVREVVGLRGDAAHARGLAQKKASPADWQVPSDRGDSEDDALNVSASGLLPGSRRILFGSRDEVVPI